MKKLDLIFKSTTEEFKTKCTVDDLNEVIVNALLDNFDKDDLVHLFLDLSYKFEKFESELLSDCNRISLRILSCNDDLINQISLWFQKTYKEINLNHNKVKIYRLRLSNGEQLPYLYYKYRKSSTVWPVMKWVTLSRRLNVTNKTLTTDVYYISKFYNYFAEQTVDLSLLLTTGNLDEILNVYQKFCTHVKTCINSKRTLNTPQVINGYIQSIKVFLKWYFLYSNKFDLQTSNEQLEYIASVETILVKKINTDYKSINSVQLAELKSYLAIGSNLNLFKENLQLRNYVLFQLLLETGVRKSEALKIKTIDLEENENRFYLHVRANVNDKIDPRPELGFKTYERTLELSESLWYHIDLYIETTRKTSMPNHLYLFTSIQGKPLSKSQFHEVFSLVSKATNIIFSPHYLRHTFTTNLLSYLIQKEKNDMEQALDTLRYLCGWSNTSRMPERYARRYLAALGNQYNLNRINSSYGVNDED